MHMYIYIECAIRVADVTRRTWHTRRTNIDRHTTHVQSYQELRNRTVVSLNEDWLACLLTTDGGRSTQTLTTIRVAANLAGDTGGGPARPMTHR